MKKHVLLGITGGIAAYKIPLLIRLLQKNNYQVIPVLTKNGAKFVTKTTLATLCQTEVLTDDDFFNKTHSPHLSRIPQPNALVIAPATANHIAKFAYGIADNLLSTLFLSFIGPKLIAPAMHQEMYENPITQENINKLKHHDVAFIGPDRGDLACGDTGIGRMVDLDTLALKIESLFLPKLNLTKKNILITAGGTKEQIDTVRHLSNDSSGKLGHMLANIASFMGAKVTLITTKTPPQNPEIQRIIQVKSASEMEKTVSKEIKANDVLYMAAAVSDYTVNASKTKIKRQETLTLELTGTTDILKKVTTTNKNKTIIGFCLADQNLEKLAKEKMAKKKVDYIIANTSKNIENDLRSMTIYSKTNSKPIQIKNKPLIDTAYQLLTLA